MRMIAGALLIVAASICLAAAIVYQGTRNLNVSSSAPQELGNGMAVILGAFGLILLGIGLSKDRKE